MMSSTTRSWIAGLLFFTGSAWFTAAGFAVWNAGFVTMR
jgi:hypothetical protein